MQLKVAVIGGGTAGFMAATHLSRHLPGVHLVQVLDPRIPTIGVGEGTTPGFRAWLDEVVGVPWEVLQREVRVTPKWGIRFENWGRTHRSFLHDSFPTDLIGLHLSATRLVDFLRPYVHGEIVEGHVSRVDGTDDGVTIEIDGRPPLAVDVAVDARGFPRELGDEHLQFSWIPTNAAMVTRTPVVQGLERTRSVARPYGWIFVIPLTEDTAYGYIYGAQAAPVEDVQADFREFLASEHIEHYAVPRSIKFPHFLCREPFKGRVLKIGNAASFVEPLEATAIAVTRHELILLTSWLRVLAAAPKARFANGLVGQLNRQVVDLILGVSLFVGWHYSLGSAFDTAFWREARAEFRRGLDELVSAEVRARFFEQLEYASRVPVPELGSIRTAADMDHVVPGHGDFPAPFGGISAVGFAQVGRGIGDPVVCGRR
jgi:tryptophan 7-halogenase